MATDRQLCQKSNIMVAMLLVPDIVRVILCNLHVVESFNPKLWDFSDVTCLMVAQTALTCCYSATLWLLVANSVHRYFLCVKRRTDINTTKMSLIISIITLTLSVSAIAFIRTYEKWDLISGSVSQNVTTPLTRSPLEGNSSGSDLSMISTTEHGSLACMNRQNVLYISKTIAITTFLIVYIIPMVIQIYFYRKIYQHLKQQRERFQSNQQVADRLHRNSKAVMRTVLASFLSHFLPVVPLWYVKNFITSGDVDLVIRIILLNAILAGTISFLILHGGYR